MKSTGIVRNIDELGRIVIPKEIRKKLGIEKNDPVEICVDGETVILSKYRPVCHFCGKSENVREFKGKVICDCCVAELKEELC